MLATVTGHPHHQNQRGGEDPAWGGGQERVMQGQVSPARQVLTGAALAPKTLETVEELRRKRCQSQVQLIPLDVMDKDTCRIGRENVCHFTSECAKRIRCGPWGCTCEMLQVCFDDVKLLQMLTSAAEDFARARVPRVVFKTFQQAHMTLSKRDDGVRGIATGTSFRRLVAKSLARQFSKEVERACAPFVRPFNEGSHRLCGTRDASFDRRQPHCDRVVRGWHRSVRPRAVAPCCPSCSPNQRCMASSQS